MGAAVSIYQELTLNTIECYKCGVLFAVTQELRGHWLQDKTEFYCPNGHAQSYSESTAERLRKELAVKERALAWEKERAASLGKQLQKEQKATARLKRRISVGVCPCCQRTVAQLARHMATKHPDFVKASGSD